MKKAPNSFFFVLMMIVAFLPVTAQVHWFALGPDTMPEFHSKGPNPNGLGLVSALHVDAEDPNIMFVGSNTGGLFKTRDGGDTWRCVTDKDFPQQTGIGSIVARPDNPDIIYIGTGITSYDREYGHGVWVSTDRGDNWNSTGLYFEPQRINALMPVVKKIIINPEDPDEMYALLKDGNYSWVYKTKNKGKRWKEIMKVEKGMFFDMEFMPGNPSTIYVGGKQLYISRDAGKTWTASRMNAPEGSTIYRVAVEVHDHFPERVYTLYETNARPKKIFLSLSEDFGNSFHPIKSFSYGILTVGSWKMELEVAPSDTSIIYVGGVYMHRSLNGGKSFQRISSASSKDAIWMHVDVRCMNIYKGDSADVLYVGHDGGLSRTSNKPGIWEHLNGRGMSITQFWGVDVSKLGGIVVGGTQDLGIKIFDRKQWTNTGMYGDAYNCIFHPYSTDTIFALSNSGRPGIKKSSDGGKTWKQTRSPAGTSLNDRPFVMDPVNPRILYIGHHDVHQSVDGMTSWHPISDFSGPPFNTNKGEHLAAIAIAPSNTDIIYAAYGTQCWSNDTKNKMFRTTDGGETWTDVSKKLQGVQWVGIADILVHPENPMKVWISLKGFWKDEYTSYKVFTSKDGGNSWENFSTGLPNLPCTKLAYIKGLDHLLVGTDAGVYYRRSDMYQWSYMSRSMPATIISDIEIDYNRKKILVSTFGRGIWEGNFPGSGSPKRIRVSPGKANRGSK